MLDLLILMRDDITSLSEKNPCLHLLAESANRLIDPKFYDKRSDSLEEFWLLLILRKAAEPTLSDIGLAHINRWLGLASAYDKIMQRQLNEPIQNLKMLVNYLEVYYPLQCVEDIRLLKHWDHSLPITLVIRDNVTDPSLRVLLTEAKRLIETIRPVQTLAKLPRLEPKFADARLSP